jgi:hypothetical protein
MPSDALYAIVDVMVKTAMAEINRKKAKLSLRKRTQNILAVCSGS